jgi:anti-anti-sigma factor
MGLTTASYVVVPRRDHVSFAERDADRTVVWLQGEHDASTVVAFWDTMGRAIALDDADVIVDLSDVEFMGSATVGVIIRARESLRRRSRSLTLRSPSRCARRVLDLYGLADLLADTPHAAGRVGP